MKREKLPVYIFQSVLIGTPIIMGIVFAFSIFLIHHKISLSTESIIRKGRESIIREETAYRKDLFHKIFLSIYSELWNKFPEYEKSLLEKNIYSAKKFLKKNNLLDMLQYRVMFGSGIVYYVDLKTKRVYHPHYKNWILSAENIKDDTGKLFVLEGIERAKKEGNAFVKYRIKGEEKLAYFDYLPAKEIVLVTYGSTKQLKRNYKYIVKNTLMNVVSAVSRMTPLILKESTGDGGRILVSTFMRRVEIFRVLKFPSRKLAGSF